MGRQRGKDERSLPPLAAAGELRSGDPDLGWRSGLAPRHGRGKQGSFRRGARDTKGVHPWPDTRLIRKVVSIPRIMLAQEYPHVKYIY